MLIGNKDLTAPVRDIDAKVEVIITSTDAKIGKGALRFDNCAVGMEIDAHLSSETVSDFTNLGTRPSRNIFDDKAQNELITFTVGEEVRNRYGFEILNVEPGEYIGHVEVVKEHSANLSFYVVDENNQSYGSKNLSLSGVPYAGGGTLTVAEGQHLLVILMGSTYNQERADAVFESVNIQIEKGSIPTLYEPYGDIQVGAEVIQYGKNIFDYTKYPFVNCYWHRTNGKLTTSNAYSCNDILIPVEHLQGKTITLNKPLSLISTGASGGTIFFEENDVNTFISGTGTLYGTFTVPANAKYMGISIPREYASGEMVQIEIGDTETEFEAFREPVVAKATVSGEINGLYTYETNTLILGDTNGHDITIEASYSIDAAGDTFRCIDRLKSISIDRIGESKFFGFGVSQKANIKMIDTNSDYSFSTNDKFKIYFDGLLVSPQMKVSEVHRDENTGELSITVYDLISDANLRSVKDITLTAPYTIRDVAAAVATKLKTVAIIPDLDEFNLSYEKGANFDGAETLREVLNAIAEATQTIYYVNNKNELVFKRLDQDGSPVLTIDREQYFTLKSSTNRRLTSIASITELGDNNEPPFATTGLVGTTQYVRNNPFWETQPTEVIKQLLDNAVSAMGNMTIHQFECSWRGNYLLEPGDKIGIITKNGEEVFCYFIDDAIIYDGSFEEATLWEYEEEEAEFTNPTNLGDALKQTYAKVDKANKQIEIVVSDINTNSEEIAQLQLDTGTITASVSNLEETTTNAFDGINEEIAQLKEKASISVNKDEVEILIQDQLTNGVGEVRTIENGFTFNDKGLTITKSDSDISTVITEDGMEIKKNSKTLLTANNEGVKAEDLHATTFLIIGKYSRFEDYGSKKRTACFWIGG